MVYIQVNFCNEVITINTETIWILFILCTLCANMILSRYLYSHKVDERIIKKGKYSLYFLFFMCFIWPAINFLLYLILPNEKIMIGTWGTVPFFQTIFNFFAYISGNLLIVSYYCLKTEHNTSNRIVCGLKILGLTVLLIISNVFCLFLDEGENYSFTSSDSIHTIVVNERNFLIAGWVTVYERKNPFIVYFNCQEETDDGYLPILNNDYTVTWHQDSATFLFGDGEGGEKSVTISFDDGK